MRCWVNTVFLPGSSRLLCSEVDLRIDPKVEKAFSSVRGRGAAHGLFFVADPFIMALKKS